MPGPVETARTVASNGNQTGKKDFMRTGRLLLSTLAVVALAAPALLSGGNALAATGEGWGTAVEVPGLAALNVNGGAGIGSMSCPSSGNCAAGGWYAGSSGDQAFVVDETGGVWGNAAEVPGLAALNAGGDAEVNYVSCSSAGNCAAGGTYVDGSSNIEVFVADEAGGVWGNAIEIPGAGALNVGGDASVSSVSCAPGTAGACSAVGYYNDSSGNLQAFVADETGGAWGNAIEVPGTAALNSGNLAASDEVSCPTAGNCTIAGKYTNSARDQEPFVARQTNGVWGSAIELAGLAALNLGPFAGIDAFSCTSPGNCSAAGLYTLSSTGTTRQLFVATEKNGSWGSAVEMPGMAALNAGQWADVESMSCTSSGNCLAGGFYEDSTRAVSPFVITQTGGVWGNAIEVPGISALNKGDSTVYAVSCSNVGSCAIGGNYASYLASGEHLRAFVAEEIGGKWLKPLQVPGAGALNTGNDAAVRALSCARGGTCSLGGPYAVGPKPVTNQVFVDSRG
jgi:hypothetical protein